MRSENFSNIKSNQCYKRKKIWYFNYCLTQEVYKFLLLIEKQVHFILAHLHLTNLTLFDDLCYRKKIIPKQPEKKMKSDWI